TLAGAQSSAPGRQKETSPSVKLSRGGVGPASRGIAAAAPGTRPATATRSARAVVASRFHPMVVVSSPRPRAWSALEHTAQDAVTARAGVARGHGWVVTVGEAAAARLGGQCREIAQPCGGAVLQGPM